MQILRQRAANFRLPEFIYGAGCAFRAMSGAVGNDGSNPVDMLTVGDVTMMKAPSTCLGPTSPLELEIIGASDSAGRCVGIVRDPFTKQKQNLDKMLRKIGPSSVAVSTEVLKPDHQLLVDEYNTSGSTLSPISSSRTLLRFLSDKGINTVFSPPSSFVTEGGLLDRNVIKVNKQSPQQSTNSLLMVAPTAFQYNEEAAKDNKFMNTPDEEHIGSQVLREHGRLYHALTEEAGVKVHLFEHAEWHGTPDAVFPNNWFTTHAAGELERRVKEPCLVQYPLKCPNRRKEQREDILEYLQDDLGYSTVIDLRHFEKDHRFLEGTGGLVLDRVNGVAYVALSERADAGLAEKWADTLGYKEVVSFIATDSDSSPIYHTNVMMAIGTEVAIVCLEAVQDDNQRRTLLNKLQKHHQVVEISYGQMNAFCGNVLEVLDGLGRPALAMSTQAYNAFSNDQKKFILENVGSFVHSPLDTLERVGGGGVRCTLAELF